MVVYLHRIGEGPGGLICFLKNGSQIVLLFLSSPVFPEVPGLLNLGSWRILAHVSCCLSAFASAGLQLSFLRFVK